MRITRKINYTEISKLNGAKGKCPTITKIKPKVAKSDNLYDQLMSSLQVKKDA